MQRTAKKCTTSYNARAEPLFCSLDLLFSDVPVAVAARRGYLKLPNQVLYKNAFEYTVYHHGLCYYVNLCKDHRDKIEVLDPLVVEDLISDNLNNRRKLARLIKQYRNTFSNILKGTAFLLRGVTVNDSSFKSYTNLKYRKYDIASERINNNKILSGMTK